MNEIERLIAGSVTPAPPAGLERRVLAAARRAAETKERAPWWTRPAVRWAWAGVTVALIIANVLIGVRLPGRRARSQMRPAVARRLQIEDPLLARALAASAAARTADLHPDPKELNVQRLMGGLS